MLGLRSFSFAALAAALLILSGRPGQAGVFNPDTFTLDNGLQVVVIEHHRIPAVHHMVWYKVGAMDEPPGQSGIAHVLEHLMFKGTETAPPGEFSSVVAKLGGRENAFTSSDITAYFQTVAREHLETVMRYEADRMTNLTLAEDQVATEILVVLEERRQRVENDPGAVLSEHVDATLYMNHPYRRPIIGWAHEIAGLTREDVLEFYRRWYAPDNAILIVAGAITADELRPLAEKYYGSIPPSGNVDRLQLHEPPHRAPRRVSLADPKVRQPVFQRAYLAPSYGTGEAAAADALDLAAALLGGGPTSELYRRLVVDEALAVAAGTSYSPGVRGPAEFTIYAAPRPGVSLKDLEDRVDALLADVVRNGFEEADVERVKGRVIANAVFARDSLSSGAYALGQALAIGRTIEDVEAWPERIEAVAPEAIAAALRGVLDRRGSVTATLEGEPGPEEAAVR